MVGRSVAWFVVASASLIQLQAQDKQLNSSQPRVFKNVTASSEAVEVVGPIDATLSTPIKASATTTKRPDQGEVDILRWSPISKPLAASKLSGLALAGPSAVLVAGKLSTTKPELFEVGESIFTLESQRTPPLTTKWARGAKNNGGQDPQIAAGHSVIAVLSWDTLADDSDA